MADIKNNLGLFEPLQGAHITVHQNRCAIVRNRNASCMKCADACTSGCISLQEGELVVSPEKCIGCGTCATVCPTCALEAHRPNDKELYEACVQAMQGTGGEVVIVCEQHLEQAAGHYDPDKVVGVKCLGRIEESLLVLLARAKAEHVVLVQGTCEGCKHNPGSSVATLVCETANTLLAAWNRDALANMACELPESVKRCDETSIHRGLLTEQFDVSAPDEQLRTSSTFQKVQEDGTLPHFLTHRRSRLLKALASLGEPQDIVLSTRLWGQVCIDTEACSSCQMCATFCPTEALKKFEDADGTFGIKHYPSRCVKCRCCTDICPSNALTLSDEVRAVDLLEKASRRFEMRPRPNPLGPHSMLGSLKTLVGDFVYER